MKPIRRAIRAIDLNLLPVLQELLSARNVTVAAKSLHLTQSAVSGCLKRLREAFDDELLVPRGRQLVLTDKAMELIPQLDQILGQVDSILEPPPFDPTLAHDRFKISTGDWINLLLIPQLNASLQRTGSRITISFTYGNVQTIRDLRHGFLDLIIGPRELIDWSSLTIDSIDSDFSSATCFSDRFVGIESLSVPAVDVGDLDAYLEHPHISFNLHPQMHASLERHALNASGRTQNDRFLVSQYALLPYLVAATGAVSVVPYSLARRFDGLLPLRTFDPPVQLPPLELIMVWSKTRTKDAAHTWLRKEITEAFQKIQAEIALPHSHEAGPHR